MATRNGLRNTIREPNGDTYIGEWMNDLKHGKGRYEAVKSGMLYDGDWKNGKRDGYGVLSKKSGDRYMKEYTGSWVSGKKQGSGTQFYKSGDRYEGEWFEGLRSGWGRMYFHDNSIYEGEWFEDKRSGTGVLRMADGNRYQGQWENDMKHGSGQYFYVHKGQRFDGVWVNGTPKCGEMMDIPRTDGTTAQYLIPELKLQDAGAVLHAAQEEYLGLPVQPQTSPPNLYDTLLPQ